MILLVSNTPSVKLTNSLPPELSSVFLGMKVDETFNGVYEWNRVSVPADNKDAATLSFTNWIPSNTFVSDSLMFDKNISHQPPPRVRNVSR